MTLSEHLLIAAHAIESRGQTSFTVEELTVQAWSADHVAFGLRGYEATHPDCNKVVACLSGRERGLVSERVFERVSPRRYRLTPEARMAIARNNGTGTATEQGNSLLTRRLTPTKLVTRELLRLFAEPALVLCDSGQEKTITFTLALAWWKSEGAEDVTSSVSDVIASLASLLRQGDVMLPGGQCVTERDLERLEACQVLLVTRFTKHLTLRRLKVERQRAS